MRIIIVGSNKFLIRIGNVKNKNNKIKQKLQESNLILFYFNDHQ
jgi:hypothetical protein